MTGIWQAIRMWLPPAVAGWVSRSPAPNSSITVLEHRVAGDLIMPNPRQHPTGGGPSGPVSPSKDGAGLRRRPVLRPSQQSAAVSPSPKGTAAAPAVAGEKQASPLKKPEAADSDKEASVGASGCPRVAFPALLALTPGPPTTCKDGAATACSSAPRAACRRHALPVCFGACPLLPHEGIMQERPSSLIRKPLQDDLESLDFDEKQKPWYRRKQFWIIAGPLIISLVFVLAVRLPLYVHCSPKT